MAEGRQLRANGRFSEALQAFQRAARQAHKTADSDLEETALISVAGCQIRLFRYREALETCEALRNLATQTGNYTALGAAAANLATIYHQLGDFPLANEQAMNAVDLLSKSWRKDYLAQALLIQAEIESAEGDSEHAIAAYRKGLTVVYEAGLSSLEASLHDQLGAALLRANKIDEAAEELNKAFQLRSRVHDQDGLAISNEHRAELELKQGNCEAALHFIDQAFASRSESFRISPQYYPINIRARILLCEGSKRTALAEFRRAVEAARRWRQGALPGDTTSTRTVAHLHDVYQDFTQLAAETALRDKDAALARQALEVLAENRAASLREEMALALGRNLQLPPRYFELLSQLQAAQARVTLERHSKQDVAKLEDLQIKFSYLQNQIGLEAPPSVRITEKIPLKNSLRDIQSRLGETQVLLSFCLGKDKSFLWAVTGGRVNLYELHGESTIGAKAYDFSKAVRTGDNRSVTGRSLSDELFGKLEPEVWMKPDWLMVPDGPLLDGVPFAALPDLSQHDTPLITSHSLRSIPSELLLLSPKATEPEPRFLGIADPIYNLADSRRARKGIFTQAKQEAGGITLARLVGSDREVRSAANSSALTNTQFLLGDQASGAVLRGALTPVPEIVHFAVHVVSPPGQPQQAALALSLTKDNVAELLTPEVIAAYRVPGSLVVLSGCASEQGKTLPSAGLLGLSRAWLLAGAAAVLVSSWPTPDDSGQFFSVFYRYFQMIKSGPLALRAAIALKQTQLEMQRGSGYRSSPSFWAAYSIISKE